MIRALTQSSANGSIVANSPIVSSSEEFAGDHFFRAPDEQIAYALAHSLADFGFAKVGARPFDAAWLVHAIDDGPYEDDDGGRRWFAAVTRHATAIAQQYACPWFTGSTFPISHDWTLVEDSPLMILNPGARPVVEPPPTVTAPADTPLGLHAAGILAVQPPLVGLHEIGWADLEHAHGSAADVPRLLEILAQFDDPQWSAALSELVGDDLLHQGNCYSATAPALAFFVELITCGQGTPDQRHHLLRDLLWGAARHASRVAHDIEDPDAEAAHVVVGLYAHRLFDLWDYECPAMRYLLAGLACLYPERAQSLRPRVRDFARSLEGSRQGAYLSLVELVLDGDEEAIGQAIEEIAQWRAGEVDDLLDGDSTIAARHLVAQAIVFA